MSVRSLINLFKLVFNQIFQVFGLYVYSSHLVHALEEVNCTIPSDAENENIKMCTLHVPKFTTYSTSGLTIILYSSFLVVLRTPIISSSFIYLDTFDVNSYGYRFN